jgi:hypothetical protein
MIGVLFCTYQTIDTGQSKYKAMPDYIEKQADINERMRSILIDWLVDVHLKFKLRTETLFLTTHIIDRYLSKAQTTRNKLQLVGVTAMLIASKYEEIYAPEVRDFVHICDKVMFSTSASDCRCAHLFTPPLKRTQNC